MLKIQTDNHNFRKNVTTDKKYTLRKMGLKFKIPSSTFFAKYNFIYFLLLTVNPLKLRGQ